MRAGWTTRTSTKPTSEHGYVLNRLSSDEEQRFEAHLVACAACQDAVESELALRDGLRELSRSNEASSTATTMLPGRRAWRPAPVLALAASLLLAVSAILAVQLRRIAGERDVARAEVVDAQQRRSDAERTAANLASRLAQAGEQAADARASTDRGASAAVFALTMTRGAADGSGVPASRIRIGGAKWIVLTVDLARPANAAQFLATLSDARSGAIVWSGGPFEAARAETLTLALDAALLHPGDFVLRLERRLADARPTPEGRYSFRVEAPGR